MSKDEQATSQVRETLRAAEYLVEIQKEVIERQKKELAAAREEIQEYRRKLNSGFKGFSKASNTEGPCKILPFPIPQASKKEKGVSHVQQ